MAEVAPFLRCPSLCQLPTCPTHVDDDRIQAIVDATQAAAETCNQGPRRSDWIWTTVAGGSSSLLNGLERESNCFNWLEAASARRVHREIKKNLATANVADRTTILRDLVSASCQPANVGPLLSAQFRDNDRSSP
jgi:hypothetical protein